MLPRFVIASLPRSNCLLISWLQSPSAVILDPKKIKSVTVTTFSLSIYHEMKGLDAMILVFWMLSYKPASSLSSFTFIKRLFSFSLLSVLWVVSSAYLRLLIFSQQSWFQLVLHPARHLTWCTLHVSYISRVTIYSLVVLLSQFWISRLFQFWFNLMVHRLKRLPAMWETWVWSLGREDPLEKEMATHSSILAWRIPWMEELGWLQSTGHKESDMTERFHFHFEPVNSFCYVLTRIQVSLEAGYVVWCSCLFKNFPVCCEPHSQRLSRSQWSRSRCSSGFPF